MTWSRCSTGAGGLLTRDDAAPSVVVDCSTVSAVASVAMRRASAARATAFLAAPVSGNGKAVAAGKLSLVVSGPEAAYQTVRAAAGAHRPGGHVRRRGRVPRGW